MGVRHFGWQLLAIMYTFCGDVFLEKLVVCTIVVASVCNSIEL